MLSEIPYQRAVRAAAVRRRQSPPPILHIPTMHLNGDGGGGVSRAGPEGERGKAFIARLLERRQADRPDVLTAAKDVHDLRETGDGVRTKTREEREEEGFY